ncbi:LuxR C-terminal-related transcriptional regulator [Streptomyces sp. NPDC093085]|uniref:LuxR C-terminal-related transcriptional regulator n=1 Tax=Streptomyces sp. NPDC093085 TaxID=3155068 RepID=UPI003418DD81
MTSRTLTRVILTPRERQVLQGLSDGNPLAAVALGLNIRENTAAGYLKLAKSKLHGAHKTTEAIAIGYATRAIALPPPLCPETLRIPDQERDLIPLIARGLGSAEMATELDQPVPRVRADGRALLKNLNARNRNHLVTRAWQAQILTPDLVTTWLR